MTDLNKEELERLITLEGEVKALKEVVEKFIIKSDANYEKLSAKMDEVIKESSNKPSFTYCNQHTLNCDKKFGELGIELDYIKENSISKTSATIFTVLTAIIAVLATLLTISWGKAPEGIQEVSCHIWRFFM